MRPRPTSPPLWFVALLALASALVLRWLDASLAEGSTPGAGAAREQHAFWPFLVTVAGIVWQGIQVAGRVTLQLLAWSVKALWAFAGSIYNAAKAIGRQLLDFGRWSLEFLRSTYERVLRPLWQHFWKWFDRARAWLQKVLAPVFQFLDAIRGHILKFYNDWVRPILDVIGIARKVLRTFASFGWDWARALDARLGELEEAIDRPFRIALAKINEVINLVNRIVTADGLFQRLALLRSIERDIRQVQNQLTNAYFRPSNDDEKRRATEEWPTMTMAQHIAEARTIAARRETRYASRIAEEVSDMKRILAGLR